MGRRCPEKLEVRKLSNRCSEASFVNCNNYSAPHVPQNVNACPTLFVPNLGPTCSEQELIQVFSIAMDL
ncbi:unnamed protein product [Camellia sinensis]